MAEENREWDETEEEEVGQLGGYATTFEDTPAVPYPGDIGTASLSALWAGIVAGAAMGVVAMMLYAMLELNFLLPLKLIAVPILGPTALLGGAGAVMLGMLLHLIVSMAVAVVFAVVLVSLLGRVGPWAGVISGMLYGLIVWIIAHYIVLPITYPLIAMGLVPWIFGLSHLVYGFVLGILPTKYRISRDEYEARPSI